MIYLQNGEEAVTRRSVILIIWLVYLIIVVLLYTVVPLIDPSASVIGDYLPLFFFLPIFFPRRLMRSNSKRQSGSSSASENKNDSGNREGVNDVTMMNTESFDQYGISYRHRNFNFLYLAGIIIILVAAFIAIYVFALK